MATRLNTWPILTKICLHLKADSPGRGSSPAWSNMPYTGQKCCIGHAKSCAGRFCRISLSASAVQATRAGLVASAAAPPGQDAVELAARGDAELGEDLAQVVLDGVRADEQPGADLRVGQPVAGQPGDLGLLGGQLLVPGGGAALAGGLAGGAQLAPGPLGERPPRPSPRACRGPCAAARARRRGGAPGAATRRTAGGRGRGRRGAGSGRGGRSTRGTGARPSRPRSAARATAPGCRAPSRCRWRRSSPRAGRRRRPRPRSAPLRAAASISSTIAQISEPRSPS